MPFGLWTRVGPRNHVLDWGPDPPFKNTILSGKRYLHSKRLAEKAKSAILLQRNPSFGERRTKCISVAGDYVERDKI